MCRGNHEYLKDDRLKLGRGWINMRKRIIFT